MNAILRIRLSLMMLVEYIIWGLWGVTVGAYMGTKGFTPGQITWAYSTTAIACMISPFFVGMIADRFFATQKVMSALHLLAAVFAYLAVMQSQFNLFFTFLLLHTICYMPTLPLANSLSFKQLSNPETQFPTIRVFGSIGWILAGWMLSWFGFDKTAGMFYLAAGFGVFMAIYCWTLPNTPPAGASKKISAREILGLDALSLFKDKNVFIFMLGSFLTCIPLTFYFTATGTYLIDNHVEKIGAIMSVGQCCEMGFFLIMPFFFKKLGVKKMLLLGMLSWAVRLFCFGYADGKDIIWLIVIGIALHGMAYDFFFVTGQLYIDKRAPQAIRSSAQGLLYFLTLGAGMLAGNQVLNLIYSKFATQQADGTFAYQWPQIWFIGAVMSLVVFIMFMCLFKEMPEKATARK